MKTVEDIWGTAWHIADESPTKHGFNICKGWRVGQKKSRSAYIITTELAKYLSDHFDNAKGVDLPVNYQIIVGWMRRIGRKPHADRRQWWINRIEDLICMSTQAFAEKYGRSASAINFMRSKLCHGVDPNKERFQSDYSDAEIVADIDGDEWMVESRIKTAHGVPLLKGRSWPRPKREARGAAAYVLTQELAELLIRYRYEPGKLDLPIDKQIIRKFRKRLGFDYHRDRENRKESITIKV